MTRDVPGPPEAPELPGLPGLPEDGRPRRRVVTLDLGGVADRAGLMERCVQALGLPEWFGRNWDALADSLGDPAVWPAGAREGGLLVVVTGWRAYAAARPDEWATAEDVFAQATDRAPQQRLTVALALGGSHQ